MAQVSFLSEYADRVGEPTRFARLCVDGNSPPNRAFFSFRGAGRCWMDSVCFRTLGSDPARYTKLGARSNERHSHYGFAGGNGFWRSDLGLLRYDCWSAKYISGSGGWVADQPGASLSVINQLYRSPEF